VSAAELTVGEIKNKRILYLVFATITLLVLGLIYAWSIFATPLGKAFGDYGPQLPQVFQVSMFAFCLSALIGSQIVRRRSAKASIILAAILMAIGFTLTALFAGVSIWVLFICYGILAGSGVGIGYNAIISLINPWFPDRIGLASGVMMMGFGISALVFGSLAEFLFGAMKEDWYLVFIMIAVVAFVVMFLLAFIAKPAPKDIGSKLGIVSVATEAKTSSTQQGFILKSRTFWVYSIWSVFVVACGLTLIGTAKQGALALNLDTAISVGFPALLVGLVSTMNGLSRILNGAIFDRIGLLPVMLIASAACFACMAGLALSLSLSIGPLYIVAAILVAFSYAACPVMGAAFARQRFGSQKFPSNLSIINCNIAVAAVINIVIVALLGPPYADNAPLIYGILAGLAVVAFVATLVFGKLYKADLAVIEKELS
jgi:OFA family oxalate/formate antiporter-like MFS transporter